MIWYIVTLVAAGVFGDHPHTFSSSRHFATQVECEAYLDQDAAELLQELREPAPDARVLAHVCVEDDEPA
jgi:hypothetical protein